MEVHPCGWASVRGQEEQGRVMGPLALHTGSWDLGQLSTCCEEGGRADHNGFFSFLRVSGHCGYCLPELPSSQLPPSFFQVTPHCEYCLPPACQGSGSVCNRPNAKGTSLVLLHSLRKCGYCLAFTGVNLSVEGVVRMLGEGHQVGFEMAESTVFRKGAWGLKLSLSHLGLQPPSRSVISTLLASATTHKESCLGL